MKTTKRKGCKNLIFVMILVGIAILISGCQTAIPVTYTEPARINMAGISKIGLISNDNYVGSTISSALMSTGKYTIVDGEAELNRYQEWKELKSYYDNATEIKAADLVSAYSSNAMRANSEYEGEILVVHGTITDFQENAIRLGIGKDSVDVYIKNSEKGKAASLEKGATVTMIGECYGLKSPDLADTGEILRILGGGQHVNIGKATFYNPPKEYIAGVDAFLYLDTSSSATVESKKEKRAKKNSEGKTLLDADGKIIYKEVTLYRRVAKATIDYKVQKFDGKVVGSGVKSESRTTSYNEDKTQLQDSATLISSAKGRIIPKIISDMIPTERTVNVTLERTDSKNQEVRTAMNEAKKLVDAKKYVAAANSYGKIYADTKDFAAGYNQAVITELAKNTDEAIILMEALVNSSNNPKAQTMLQEMKSRSYNNQKSAEQMK